MSETIIAVIIGSGITLFGVLIQGIIAFVLLTKQKKIEANHGKINREHELKKENYINGLKELMYLINAFIDFTKPGKDYDEYGKEIQKHFLQLSTIDLVADKSTLEPLHKFQKYYFNICTELMKDKIPVDSLVIDRTFKQKWYDYYSKKIDDNTARLSNNRFTGTDKEQEYVNYLIEDYHELCKERDRYSGEITSISDEILKAGLEFKRKAIEKVLLINSFYYEYVQAARNDLGFESISMEFNQVNSFHENVRRTMNEIFKAAEAMDQKESTHDDGKIK